MKKYIQNKIISVAAMSIAVCLSTVMPLTNLSAFPFPWGNSLWKAIGQSDTLLSADSNERVQQEINKLSKDKSTLQEDAQNSQVYLSYVYQQVMKRHMPAELAFLPMIESNYYPYARSYCGAEGLWQLMAPTAKDHGIPMNWWFDGRRDFVASTNAGLDQLQHLHAVFGDWLLAIAAYNTGEGNIHKAIVYNRKHHLPTDFWSLKLAKETEEYVPKLLAVATILKDSGHYHVRLPQISQSPDMSVLTLNQPVNLAELAKITDIDTDELLRLNPAFLRWITPVAGQYHLIVPSNKVNVVLGALPTFTSDNLWYHYTVAKADTLKSIATQYHVTQDTLMQVNNLSSHKVKVGETVLIPIDYASQGHLYAVNDNNRPALPAPVRLGRDKVHFAAADFSTYVVTQSKINVEQKQVVAQAPQNQLASDATQHPSATLAAATTQTQTILSMSEPVSADQKSITSQKEDQPNLSAIAKFFTKFSEYV